MLALAARWCTLVSRLIYRHELDHLCTATVTTFSDSKRFRRFSDHLNLNFLSNYKPPTALSDLNIPQYKDVVGISSFYA